MKSPLCRSLRLSPPSSPLAAGCRPRQRQPTLSEVLASGREVSPGLGAGCCGPAWRASARIQGGHCGLHKPGEAWPPPPPRGAAALKKQAAGDAISGPTLCRPWKSQSPSLCAALKTAGRNCLGWEKRSAGRSHFLGGFAIISTHSIITMLENFSHAVPAHPHPPYTGVFPGFCRES